MNSDVFDANKSGQTMNEELSEILEKALMYATPLPVSPPEENVATESPEANDISDLLFEHGNLEQFYDQSIDFFTHNVGGTSIPNNSYNCNTPNISTTESSEHIFFDDLHDNQDNTVHKVDVPYQNLESQDSVSNETFEGYDGELSNIEINAVSSSMDSNLEILEPDASLMEIHPDSTSGEVHDLNDIADACLRFENDPKLSADSTTRVSDGEKPKVKRRRRREKNPDPPPPPVLPPCDICNDKS